MTKNLAAMSGDVSLATGNLTWRLLWLLLISLGLLVDDPTISILTGVGISFTGSLACWAHNPKGRGPEPRSSGSFLGISATPRWRSGLATSSLTTEGLLLHLLEARGVALALVDLLLQAHHQLMVMLVGLARAIPSKGPNRDLIPRFHRFV